MAGELTTTITFADGDQVTSAKLNQIITGASFTTSAVTGTTLTVTGGKLKVGTITSSEMGAASVTATALASNAVTTAKIYDGNVITEKLADSAVTAVKIAPNTITFSRISTGTIATKTLMQNETASLLVTPDMVKHSKRAAKAHGCIAIGGGTRSILPNSVNVTSVSRDSATTTRVVLDNDMSSDDYTVLLTWESASAASNEYASVYDKTAGGFYIKHATEDTAKRINFVAFGNYA